MTFNPEDQLKGPVAELLKSIGKAMGLTIEVATEVHADELGRPDLGVAVKGLLNGHVELKAPGKGADPAKFKGGDREQWERFQNLPNLIYTDGNDWALVPQRGAAGQHGAANRRCDQGRARRLSAKTMAAALEPLLRDFFLWQPIVPALPPPWPRCWRRYAGCCAAMC